ncbi:RidA family protein [Paenibacillus antri]|uniref:RidA family protein n=1 Tax=Paenibacillus antri TaxID=2582848 RepID=A0A5R9G8T1_9BACL|nr:MULTISPECIES: RidA family protein [Paenibacillus]TLS51479.1 RidA family protein [Paenibacillus antri]
MENKINSYGTEVVPFSVTTQSDTLLFISGQGGFDPITGELAAHDLEGQTVRTIQNVAAILSQSGVTLEDILKVNVYLSDRKHYEGFNRIYAELIPRPYPARTLVYCELNFDLLVEIDVIARLKRK